MTEETSGSRLAPGCGIITVLIGVVTGVGLTIMFVCVRSCPGCPKTGGRSADLRPTDRAAVPMQKRDQRVDVEVIVDGHVLVEAARQPESFPRLLCQKHREPVRLVTPEVQLANPLLGRLDQIADVRRLDVSPCQATLRRMEQILEVDKRDFVRCAQKGNRP